MIFLLHLVDFYGTCIGKYTSPTESVIATGLATFLLAWLATGYRASFHASGLPDTLRLVSYRVYPSLPKSSKYLVRRCFQEEFRGTNTDPHKLFGRLGLWKVGAT